MKNLPREKSLFGSLERECSEEICTYGEVQEIYKDESKTECFWNDYIHGRNSHVASLLRSGGEILRDQGKINALQRELRERKKKLLDLEDEFNLKVKQLFSQ
ncbi:coagulation factor VII-like [Amblyraja radiata]|uniref:coagulation factor VII-like n=1 Tax=Amblyraja radiata TaxID=386614 RepID=UPI001402BC8D|nr:coagulation factor VII-like [Amblyraja radiata]